MTADSGTQEDYRLPYSVAPRRYELLLSPDLTEATFEGEESIEIEVLEPTDRIVVHAKELELRNPRLVPGWRASSDEGVALEFRFEDANEWAVFTAPSVLGIGRYTLSCAFTGTLNDKLHGFYRSVFTDDEGTERVIATTQFEETDARLAFPCFDEPDRKASFAITLDAPSGMLAVSNGRAIEVHELPGGGTRTRFAETIAMSTYLVAFIVGPLEATPPVDADGIELRVIHVPGKGHLTAPALDCAKHALGFYTEYFGLPYPGNKIDLVGLPDFAAGAMENLGCVTFREAILLADPLNSSQTELERMAEVVEHELAHMWFGDLVTMGWWNGIWLNEAFATFMALCCQDDYRPEWQCFVGFSRGKAAALGVDGLHATRPVEFPVRHPDEAAAMFDVLTYQKGASVLWMLERYLGREIFRAGVRRYLEANQFDNTETTDLWDAIEAEAGDQPIRALMDSWIFQGGYPLLSAKRTGDGITLSQRPFAYLPDKIGDVDSEIGSDWLVPVVASSMEHRENEHRLLLGSMPGSITNGDGRLVLNAGGAGFYRLDYDGSLFDRLLEALGELEATERYNLLADTWAIALSEGRGLDRFVAIADKLTEQHEEDPHVLSVVTGASALLDLVAYDRDRPAIHAYVRRLLAPILGRIGWERRPDDEEPVRLLRASLVATLGTLGEDVSVVARCRDLFDADHKRNEPIDADLAASVLAVVVAHANRDDFDLILDRYRHPQSPMDEIRHLNSLANLTDVGLARETHELCRSDFRTQNAPFLLGSMLLSRPIAAATWEFIEKNFDELVERYPDNSLHRMLGGVPGLAILDDDDEAPFAAHVRAFCEAKITGARRKLIAQSLERLDVNVRFGKSVRAELAALIPS